MWITYITSIWLAWIAPCRLHRHSVAFPLASRRILAVVTLPLYIVCRHRSCILWLLVFVVQQPKPLYSVGYQILQTLCFLDIVLKPHWPLLRLSVYQRDDMTIIGSFSASTFAAIITINQSCFTHSFVISWYFPMLTFFLLLHDTMSQNNSHGSQTSCFWCLPSRIRWIRWERGYDFFYPG